MKRINDWKIVQIKDLGKVVTGKTPPTVVADNFGDDYLFITPSDMDGRKEINDTERKISFKGAAILKSYILPAKSVCVSCIGWQMGKVVMTTQTSFTNQQINTIIPNDKVIPDFVYYGLSTRREELQLLGSVGTRTPILNKSSFEKVNIYLPPLPTQHKIAYILSAYDDLIENNTRRIKILEEMAQTLYHEWFVKFRFPGHEQVKMVESELGLIPEGWNVFTIRDASSYINRGIAPKYDEHSNSIVINQKCIRDGRLNLELGRRHVKKVPQEKLILFGDVLINSTGIGTLGRVAQVYKNIPDCTVDSHVSIVRPGELVNIDYFGFTLLQLQPYFDKMGVGSTGQTELSRQSIADTNFLLPPRDLQETFSQVVSPMRHAIVGKFTKNSNLRQTRDLLLPKLISGEIDIENLEIDIGKIAA
jgi:type I restriction enzyme S subunit